MDEEQVLVELRTGKSGGQRRGFNKDALVAKLIKSTLAKEGEERAPQQSKPPKAKPRKKVAGVDMPDVEPNPGPAVLHPMVNFVTAEVPQYPVLLGTPEEMLLRAQQVRTCCSSDPCGGRKSLKDLASDKVSVLDFPKGTYRLPPVDFTLMSKPIHARMFAGRLMLQDEHNLALYPWPVDVQHSGCTTPYRQTWNSQTRMLEVGRFHWFERFTSLEIVPLLQVVQTKEETANILTWVVNNQRF